MERSSNRSGSSEEIISLLGLPNEILLKIMRLLPKLECIAMASTCRRTKGLILDVDISNRHIGLFLVVGD